MDPTTVAIVSGPTAGTLEELTPGQFTYTPTADFSGPDSFTYTVEDNEGGISNEATVTINVTPVNDTLPTAVDDGPIEVEEDGSVIILAADLAANDTDDGTVDPTTVAIVSGPTAGTLEELTPGQFTYTPTADFSGPDSFTYTVEDNEGGISNEATVTINVTPVNDTLPTAVDDGPIEVEEDGSVIILAADLAANDTDDGTVDPTTVAIVSGLNRWYLRGTDSWSIYLHPHCRLFRPGQLHLHRRR